MHWIPKALRQFLPTTLRYRAEEAVTSRKWQERREKLRHDEETDPHILRMLEDQYVEELRMIEEEREVHFTEKLLRKARRLRVPTPPMWYEDGEQSPYWRTGPLHRRYLSRDGIKFVRKAIREEEKWRMEKRHQRIALLTAITGVIGALTGLVAVWLG